MKDKKIIIAGLGVAGSRLAAKLAEEGLNVEGFDVDSSYRKPCGEAVPVNDYTKRIIGKYSKVKTVVNSFRVNVDGKTVFYEEFKDPVWYIIDKEMLVKNLRMDAESHGANLSFKGIRNKELDRKDSLVIEARGPFSPDSGEKLPVYRILYKPSIEWPPNHVLIEFDTRELGFYWIFPSEPEKNIVNAGGGFYSLQKGETLNKKVKKFLEKKTGILKIVNSGASLLRVKPSIRLFEGDNRFYIGEAAGLVMTMTGEGIRPALMSADYLAESIVNSHSIAQARKNYLKLVQSLVKESELATKLFRIVEESIVDERGKILSNVPKLFWRDYFKAKVRLSRILLGAILEPSKSVHLVKYLSKLF